jgi:spermidine/putrescine transport system permease protein
MAQATLPTTSSAPAAIPGIPLNVAQIRADLAVRRYGKIILRILPWFGYGLLWVPILILVIFSFNNSRSNASWQGFTLNWYNALLGIDMAALEGFKQEARFSTRNLVNAVQNSLVIAFASTVISTILGTMIAIGLERYRFRGRRFIDLILYLPVVIPEITMGLSLQLFFSAVFRGIRDATDSAISPTLSTLTVIIGHVVFCMPFVSITVRARLAGMSKTVEEAARDLGANEWRVMWRITLPLLAPGIVAGALLAFTLSLDDYVVTLFTNGPGGTTLPQYVQSMIKYAVDPTINALSTIVIAVSMSLVLVSLLVQRNRKETA